MNNLINIARAIYCDPWLILPEMHKVLADIVEAHIQGGAVEKEYRLRGAVLASREDRQYGQEDRQITDVQPYQVVDGVAVVPLYGVIGRRVGALEQSSGVTDVDVFARAVQRAAGDSTVSKILIDVDSPGGSVPGVQAAADVVRQAGIIKHTMSYSGGTMASAAYWIATGANVVYADETAMVGSIGVYTQILDTTRAMENAGIRQQVFASGKFKAAGVGGTSLTEEQKEDIQNRVNDLADVFKQDVLRYNPSASSEVMQGQVYTGRRAMEAGLINSVSGFDKAFQDLLSW